MFLHLLYVLRTIGCYVSIYYSLVTTVSLRNGSFHKVLHITVPEVEILRVLRRGFQHGQKILWLLGEYANGRTDCKQKGQLKDTRSVQKKDNISRSGGVKTVKWIRTTSFVHFVIPELNMW
jgi:hypothetical protein